MINKYVLGAIIGAGFLSIIPAQANNWDDKIEACASAAQEQGLAASADYRLKFVSASKRQLTIKMTPSGGGESIVAVCQISRGKVKDVVLKA